MKEVDISSLHGIYKELAEIIGVELTIAVFNELKGQQITFPLRLYEKDYVIEEVKTRYNGANLKELAREFNYTERWIRKLVNSRKEDIKNGFI